MSENEESELEALPDKTRIVAMLSEFQSSPAWSPENAASAVSFLSAGIRCSAATGFSEAGGSVGSGGVGRTIAVGRGGCGV
jgi:hypothetical protein